MAAANPNDRLPHIVAGLDTLILDTVHTIYWPGGCYEPCYYAYESLRRNKSLETHTAENAADRAAYEAQHYVHKVLPSASARSLGGVDLWVMNGRFHVYGRSGIYFPGTAQQCPFNLYGRFLHYETMEELYGVWRKVKWK